MQNISHPTVKISSYAHPAESVIMANASSIPLLTKLPKLKSSDQSWLTIHQQFASYGRNAKEWTRKCILLLPEIEKQQIWRKKRFHNIYDYAAKLAGMSRPQVDEALRVLRRISNKPALLKLLEEKGLQRVRPIAAIATIEDQNFWAEKGRSMSKNTLEVYVQNYRREILPREASQSVNLQNLPFEPEEASISQATAHSARHGGQLLQSTSRLSSTLTSSNLQSAIALPSTSPKITLILQLNPQVADQLQKIKGQSDWNETIDELLKLRREKLEQTKPEVVENASRPISVAIENYVLAKTNCTCAFPGCYKPYEILHHTDRFAMYHIHDPDKIFPLCEAHERLAHLGLIENEDFEPQFWKIRTYPDYDDPRYEIDQLVSKFR